MTNNKLPAPVSAYAAVSPDGTLTGYAFPREGQYEPSPGYSQRPVTIIPTEQYEAMVALCAAADAVLEETAGRKAFSSGPTGMTIEAQLRASHYRISAWAVEEIREAAAALAALKEQAEEKPTPTVSDEWEILKRLAAGDRIHFSQDGEMAWFIGGDKALVGGLSGLRRKGYLLRKGDDEENYRGGGEYDTISEAGLAALKEQDHG